MNLWRRWERQAALPGARADKTLFKLIQMCGPEIDAAVEAFEGCLFVPDMRAFYQKLAWSAVREAAQTLRNKPERILLRYIEECALGFLQEEERDWQSQIKKLKPAQALDLCMRWQRNAAAFVLDNLSPDQRDKVARLAFERVADERFILRLEDVHEPEDTAWWVVWYLYRLKAMEPQAMRLLTREEGPTDTRLLIEPTGEFGPQPKNKHGAPIDLAGPLHIRAFEELSRMMSVRLDSRIRAEHGSAKNMARSLAVDASVIKRWKDHPEWHLLPKPKRTKDGITYEYKVEDVLRSARIVKGSKRGPKLS